MFPFFKINKTYKTSKPTTEVAESLSELTSVSCNSSKYSVYGKVVSTDPPIFLFRSNSPLMAWRIPQDWETNATLSLDTEKEKTLVKATTNSNWLFPILFWICIVASIVKILGLKKGENWIIIVQYLVIAFACIFLDRFFKKLMLVYLERDLKL